jgi:aryl-alcohol dehydrogenase-like predicted oxidoreductase
MPMLSFSKLCLGTMTWGSQTSRADAFRQLDLAHEHGITFVDAGEMYPIPPTSETHGQSEVILGQWLKERTQRHRFQIGGKVVGDASKTPYLRQGQARLNRVNIVTAVEDTLRRLGVDCLDLFQLHWPDRHTNNFGQLGLIEADRDGTPLLETLKVLDELVRSGKVRAIGVCNETPWGLMKMIALAEAHGLAPVAVLQNPYNLLNRTAEIGLVEVLLQERVQFAAYSPLAFGTLTGKYLQNRRPAASRLALYPQYTRYNGCRTFEAVRAYIALATKHGISPIQLAIAFATSRPFISTVILGASSSEQLEEDLAASSVKLSGEILEAIDQVHANNPNPAP